MSALVNKLLPGGISVVDKVFSIIINYINGRAGLERSVRSTSKCYKWTYNNKNLRVAMLLKAYLFVFIIRIFLTHSQAFDTLGASGGQVSIVVACLAVSC